MITLPIKALSVNSGFQGKRFKTVEYKKYERNVLLLLPKMQVGKAPYKLYIEFGLSSKLQDLDNCIKFLQDCLVKKYGFDDRDIYNGEWKNDQQHGNATLFFSEDGSIFEGKWKKGLINGPSKLTDTNGNYERGTFVNGKKHGVFLGYDKFKKLQYKHTYDNDVFVPELSPKLINKVSPNTNTKKRKPKSNNVKKKKTKKK
jgi:hypothetical protein